MSKIFRILSWIICVLVSFSCASIVYAELAGIAVAEIKGTMPDSQITGTVTFTETDAGLVVNAEVKNVPNPGKHGFHVHENGD